MAAMVAVVEEIAAAAAVAVVMTVVRAGVMGEDNKGGEKPVRKGDDKPTPWLDYTPHLREHLCPRGEVRRGVDGPRAEC